MNRQEIIFLYDIKDNNPNGDPLDSNKPRIDEETGINYVTDVRLKRTIRDYLHEYKGEQIFVREIRNEKGEVQDAKARAKDFGKNKEEVAEKVLRECIDVRLFGATIPTEFKKEKKSNKENSEEDDKKEKTETSSITFTGPVQFNIGRSLHKVSLKRIKGTGAFASGENKEARTFREEYILPYSLIGFYGIVNENAAKITNLTNLDVKLLIEAIWNGTKNLISRSKVGQQPRLLLNIVYKEGNFHIGDLIKDIKLFTELNEEEEIRGPEDYVLKFDGLVDALMRNKDKIARIEYKVDSKLKFIINGKETAFYDILKDFSLSELQIKE